MSRDCLLLLVRPFDAALTIPPLTIYLLWREWPRVWRERRFLNSGVGRFLIPVTISAAIILLQNAVQFGSPTVFAEARAFDTPLRTGLNGLLLSVERGTVFFSPPTLATVPGLIMLWNRRPAETLLFAVFLAAFPLGYATYSHWDGDVCWGPRFLVPMLPFAVLPLGELVVSKGMARRLVLMLGIAGVLVQLARPGRSPACTSL